MFTEAIRNNYKKLLILAAVVLIAVAVYGIYTLVTRNGKIPVAVSVVPGDSKITLDGNSAPSSGTLYLTSGDHTIKVSKDGFTTETRKYFVDEDHKTINVSLSPISEEAKKWAKENSQLYLDNEGRGGAASEEEGIAFRDKNPIVDVLPYDGLLYTIGYQTDTRDPSGNSIIITIDAGPGNRNAAVEQLREFGYDPTDFVIKFNDYTNPFAS